VDRGESTFESEESPFTESQGPAIPVMGTVKDLLKTIDGALKESRKS
jgi:hypothetical protein